MTSPQFAICMVCMKFTAQIAKTEKQAERFCSCMLAQALGISGILCWEQDLKAASWLSAGLCCLGTVGSTSRGGGKEG